MNGRACSLPGAAPGININYDSALTLCKNKGNGWTAAFLAYLEPRL
ncbi:MAG: hypothetical protein LBJ36_11490 [Synergistaceae bacterium]|nr:hypothetical protein [Synergistaceae bacterium]